jgi:hypothetical protein
VSPLAFAVESPYRARVPIVQLPFRIGRQADCDLVIDDPSVAPDHAKLGMVKGEYMLSARDGACAVNDRPVPLMPLRHGDGVTLGDARLRFENRMEGSFLPPGASITQAWTAWPGFAESKGPERYGPLHRLTGSARRRAWRGVDPEGGAAVVVKTWPLRDASDGDRWLGLLSTLAGARHPSVAPVLDGGIAPSARGPVRWMATAWVDGTTVEERLADEGPLATAVAVGVLRALARGLAHLHARGVVHRDVSPGNVVLRGEEDASLVDLGQSYRVADGLEPSSGVVGTPGYLAPEEVMEGARAAGPAVDVYGLGAVGFALVTGRPPAAGDDVLDALARAARPPLRPSDLGVTLPEPLETALLAAMARAPAERPTAAAFERALAFADAALRVGGFE